MTLHNTLRQLPLLTTALLLAACGGGDGTSTTGTGTGTGTATGTDPQTLQGRWATASGVTPAYTAIVVPDAATPTTSATAWILANDASRLVKTTASNTQSATGKNYDLATPANPTTDISAGSYSANLTASPKSVSFTNVLGSTLTLSQSDALSGVAATADAAGTWRASAGAVDLTWTLTDTGAMSGSSTAGCSYSGNITTPTTVKLYRISFTETCSGTATAFTGIATLNTEKTRLTVTATTASDAKGTALFFVKP
jgi:hypothetical protein